MRDKRGKYFYAMSQAAFLTGKQLYLFLVKIKHGEKFAERTIYKLYIRSNDL